MAESNFVDYVKIYCRSGKGGRGSTHMRREKYTPNGGPDGGDGGRGGHVILRGNRNYWTLLHLRYDRHAMAGHGESGSKNRSFGKDGADKIIEVPCGTVVYNAETGEYVCDVTEHGQEVILLKGGRGGLGNWHFKTATRQAPRFAQPGGKFKFNSFYKEIALAYGLGIRFDFNYFLIRVDMGLKMYDPSRIGNRPWVIAHHTFSRDASFHFAVGYPF